MISDDVQLIVDAQLGGATSTRHGWNFAKLLIPPTEVSLKDSAGNSWTVWAVLKEPDQGYLVFYDPDESCFGLATSGVMVSQCPDLITALEGM